MSNQHSSDRTQERLAWTREELVKPGRNTFWPDDIEFLLGVIDNLEEQFQAERREEWREGVVNVLDHEGTYLGCMGSETWAWTLDGGIAKLKEQFETFLDAAWKFEQEMSGGEFVHFGEFRRALVAASGTDRASNPASVPDYPHLGPGRCGNCGEALDADHSCGAVIHVHDEGRPEGRPS